jgi:hypothetical protein
MFRFKIFFLVTFLSIEVFSQSFKLMTYNSLNFSSNSVDRIPHFKMIMDSIQPDIVVFQELFSNTALQIMLNGAFSSSYSAGVFIDGPDTDRGMIYRNDIFKFVSNTYIPTALRDVNMFTVVYLPTGDTVRIFGVHLKASSGIDNENTRLNEVLAIRNVTNQFTTNQHFIICGDFNFYSSYEPGYQKLIENQGSNFGHVVDPVTLVGVFNDPAYSQFHTQSPRRRSFGGGITGGMDDRFDFIFYSQSIAFNGGMDYVPNSLWAVGNDGLHYNDSINRMPNLRVSFELANALHDASDHLPVIAEFSFPGNSIQESIKNVLHVFPNPSSDFLNIQSEKTEIIEVSLFSVSGHEILKQKTQGTSTVLNIESLKSGIYFLKIQLEEQVVIQKFEKK